MSVPNNSPMTSKRVVALSLVSLVSLAVCFFTLYSHLESNQPFKYDEKIKNSFDDLATFLTPGISDEGRRTTMSLIADGLPDSDRQPIVAYWEKISDSGCVEVWLLGRIDLVTSFSFETDEGTKIRQLSHDQRQKLLNASLHSVHGTVQFCDVSADVLGVSLVGT